MNQEENKMIIGMCQKKTIASHGKNIEVAYLNIHNEGSGEVCYFLYLFPGQGTNDEWEREDKGHIRRVMSEIYRQKNRPNMTIVMPYPYYGGDKVKESQQMYNYLPDIINAFEGNGAWEDNEKYKMRAIAGLCLGGLCTLKCALHWENIGMNRKFYGIGIFSPAGGGTDGRWLNGSPNFRFPKENCGRYLYISEGEQDEKKVHAELYSKLFKENKTPVDLFKTIRNGRHDWNAFKAAFIDFMLQDIFAYDNQKK